MTPAAFSKTHAAAFSTGKAWHPEDFQTYFDRPNTLVAGDADGFIIGTYVIDEAEILTVATNPANQRQGKARAAMTAFIEKAQNKGVVRIFLEVAADNDPAIALYDSFGFQRIGLRQNYYQRANAPACDAILMERLLPQR